jgi:tetratricopeptide (TPR) repeat protein
LILYLLGLWNSNISNFPEKSIVSKKNFKEIQIVLEQLRGLDEKDNWYKMMLAEYDHARGEQQKAFEIYQQLVEDKNNLSTDILWRIQSGLSQLLMEIGQTDSAITFLIEVIDYNPTLPQPYFRLFDAYKRNGLLINAFEIANKCLKGHSSKNLVRKWYVEEIKTINKINEAIEYLSDLTKNTHSNSEFLLVLAMLEYENGHHDIVEKIILELSQRKDLPSNCLVDLAHLYLLLGNISNALNCLNNATNNNNNESINIRLGQAYLYRLVDNYSDSIKSLFTLLECDKKNITFLLFLAENQFKKNDNKGLHSTLEQIQSELSDQNWELDIIQNSLVFDKNWIPNSWSKILTSNENVYAFIAFLYYYFGEYKISLEMAEKGLINNSKLNPLRVFTAELAHATLNDEKALHIIDGLDSIELKNKNNKNLIDLICQKAEIVLSRGEEILTASLISDYVQDNENNLRLKCLQSRLFLRQGDNRSAQLFFEEVLRNIDKSQEKESDGKFDNQISELPKAYPIWLLEAAIELENFEFISKLINKSSELQQLTPLVLLLNLKAISSLIITNDYLLETKAKGRIQDIEAISKNKWSIIEEYTCKDEADYPELSNWINIFTQIKNPKEEIHNIEINKNTIPFIAYLYRKTGKLDQLIGLLDHFSNSSEVHAQISIAFQTSDYEKAIAHIQESIALESNQPIYYAFYAILLFRRGIVDQALELIERALSLCPDEFEWHLMAADGCEKTNKPGKALIHLQKVFELDSGNVSIARRLGRGYYENGDRAMAVKIIQKYAQAGSECLEELVILAEVNLAEKKYKTACDYARRANHLNPQSSEPYVLLGKIALDLKNIDNAWNNAKRAIELDPKNINAYLLYSSVIELKQGEVAALKFLEFNKDFSLDCPEIIIEKTKLISRVEGTEKAYDFIQRYSLMENRKILTALVKIEIALGKNDEAENHAIESLDIHPDQPDLQSILGKLNEKKGNLDQAIKYYSNAITLDPMQTDNYLELCDIYLKQRNSNDALKVVTHGIEVFPENAKLHTKIGMIYWEMKEYEYAENAFEKAAFLNPKDDEIIRQLSETKVQNILHQKCEVEINK